MRKRLQAKRGEINKRKRERHQENPDKQRKAQAEWRKANPDKTKLIDRRSREKNREKRNARNRVYMLERRRADPEAAKEERKRHAHKSRIAHSKYTKRRYQTDDVFKLGASLRNQATRFLRRGFRGSLKRAGSFVRDLGCDLEAFWIHLESLFQRGMSRENYGEWHLDHIYPLSKADLTDRVQFLAVVNYRNYRPLWGPDNLSKRDTVTDEGLRLFAELCEEFRQTRKAES